MSRRRQWAGPWTQHLVRERGRWLPGAQRPPSVLTGERRWYRDAYVYQGAFRGIERVWGPVVVPS